MFKIHEGDSTFILQAQPPVIEDNSIDVVFTSPDPPFNYVEMHDLLDVMTMCYPKVKDTGSIWINLGDVHNTKGELALIPERFVMEMVVERGWKLRDKLIWHRPVFPPVGSNGSAPIKEQDPDRFRRDYEFLYHFVKQIPGYFISHTSNFDMKDVLDQQFNTSVFEVPYIEPEPGKFESGFPEFLIQVVLGLSCPASGYVLDPFCGTGTTLVCALSQGFNAIGIERKPELIGRLNDRLNNAFIQSQEQWNREQEYNQSR